MSSKARKSLLQVAARLGYRWKRNGSHIVLRHPVTGETREVPYDVAEGRRGNNWRNYVADLRRGAGRSTQGAEHVEGTRRVRRVPAPQVQPKTKAARRAEIIAEAKSRTVERLDELDAIRRLMG